MDREKALDMTRGSLWPQLFGFALPLMLSGMLQLLFTAADTVVVGRFAGVESLSAVGACGSLVTLITNLFIGISVGTGSVAARFYGAKEEDRVSRCVHTAVGLSSLGGLILLTVCFFGAESFLTWTGCPENVLGKAALYLRVVSFGFPGQLCYNFGAALLRSHGDTKRPLFYLTGAGAVNVVLNLILVLVFRMDVAGVAVATAVSHTLSAGLCFFRLTRVEGCFRLFWSRVRIHKAELWESLRIGLPAGLQSSLFALSNVFLQSTVNSFGHLAMAGHAAATSLAGFTHAGMDAVTHTALTFCSCNYGAGKLSRMKRIFKRCLLLSAWMGLVLGLVIYLGSGFLLTLYTDDASAVIYGQAKLLVFVSYFLCGLMNVIVAYLRSIGCSVIPMINALIFACGVRTLWLFTVVPWVRPYVGEMTAFATVYLAYPVTWTLAALAHLITLAAVWKKQTAGIEKTEV